MGYSGAVSSKHSNGRIVVEAVWWYRHRPSIEAGLAARQKHTSAAAKQIAWKAQRRVHARYGKLSVKTKQKFVTVVAVELLGPIWAIGAGCTADVARCLNQGKTQGFTVKHGG